MNQKSLKERWQEHLACTHLDLRGLLIEAVAVHQGWEESAIALVDEAIMPVIEAEKPTTARCQFCDAPDGYHQAHCKTNQIEPDPED